MVMACTSTTDRETASSQSTRHVRTHCRRRSSATASTSIKQKETGILLPPRPQPQLLLSAQQRKHNQKKQKKQPNTFGLTIMTLVTTLQTICLLLFLLGYFDTTATTTSTTSMTFGKVGVVGRVVHAAPVYFGHTKHKPRRSACETLMKSIPALSVYHYCVSNKSKDGGDGDDGDGDCNGVLSAFQDRDNNNKYDWNSKNPRTVLFF